MYKALKSFAGAISMRKGEVRTITNSFIIQDLLHAGYIEEIKPAKGNSTEESEPAEKPKRKKQNKEGNP